VVTPRRRRETSWKKRNHPLGQNPKTIASCRKKSDSKKDEGWKGGESRRTSEICANKKAWGLGKRYGHLSSKGKDQKKGKVQIPKQAGSAL